MEPQPQEEALRNGETPMDDGNVDGPIRKRPRGGGTPIKYSSTGGMNKALKLSLEFYKLHKRLPNAHESHNISQRALELLAISDPGARHYVTGPQICSQFNNVSRDLSALEKRLNKKKEMIDSSGEQNFSESQRRTYQWEDERYRVLQQVQIAKRSGHVSEDYETGELAGINALASMPPSSAFRGGLDLGGHRKADDLYVMMDKLRSSLDNMTNAIATIGMSMNGTNRDDVINALHDIQMRATGQIGGETPLEHPEEVDDGGEQE